MLLWSASHGVRVQRIAKWRRSHTQFFLKSSYRSCHVIQIEALVGGARSNVIVMRCSCPGVRYCCKPALLVWRWSLRIKLTGAPCLCSQLHCLVGNELISNSTTCCELVDICTRPTNSKGGRREASHSIAVNSGVAMTIEKTCALRGVNEHVKTAPVQSTSLACRPIGVLMAMR